MLLRWMQEPLNGRACDDVNMVQSGVRSDRSYRCLGLRRRAGLCKASCHAELKAGKMHSQCLIFHPSMEYSIIIMFHLSLCEYNAALESQNSRHGDRDALQSFTCPKVQQLQANH